jgi:hypothetical protein
MTEIQIANMALTMLGVDTITTFADSTEQARAMLAVYSYIRTDMLAEYPWSWAIKRAELDIDDDNLLSNGNMETWTAGTAIAPTGWTAAGTGAAVARSTAHIKKGSYSARVTRTANDCYIYQAVHATKSIAYWQGRDVTLGCWVLATTASQAKVTLYDGVGSTSSDFHAGDGEWEWLEVTHSVDSAATEVTVRLEVVTTDGAVYFDNATIGDGDEAPLPVEPAYGYTYQHDLPANYVRILEVSNGNITLTGYRIEGGKVLSDYDTIYAKYVATVTDDTITDIQFCSAFATRLAAELAYKLTSNSTLAGQLAEMAMLKLSKAKAANAQESNSIDTVDDDQWELGRAI